MKFRRRKTVLIGAVATTVVALSGGAWAIASEDATHDRSIRVGDSQRAIAITGASGALCKMGYDTESSTLTPPDDSTTDNAPAGSVTFRKSCDGAVIGRFSSEVSAPTTADFVHLDLLATCLGNGGLTKACTPGQKVFASPGHTFFQVGAATTHVNTATMVWAGLKRGKWKFEVLPGGNDLATLQFRTFTVEAYTGG
jgi:hypothetical protein